MERLQGGTSNNGTIISFDPAKNKDSLLWNFGAAGDGGAAKCCNGI